MGDSRRSGRAPRFAAVALAAVVGILGTTSLGVQSAAASEADSIGSLVNQASSTPFPVGYVVGGVLVVLGLAGGIYGQMLRRRGRRPPR